MFRLNAWVRITFKVNGEDVMHVGRWRTNDGGLCHIGIPNVGMIHVPEKECEVVASFPPLGFETWHVGDEDKSNVKSHKNATITTQPLAKAAATRTRAGGKSKVEMIVDIIHNHPGLSRKEYIQMAVDAGISSAAGCSTFYNSARKLA